MLTLTFLAVALYLTCQIRVIGDIHAAESTMTTQNVTNAGYFELLVTVQTTIPCRVLIPSASYTLFYLQ